MMLRHLKPESICGQNKTDYTFSKKIYINFKQHDVNNGNF